MKKKFLLFPFLIIFLLFITSCKYGLTEVFYRSNGVNTRSSTITDIDSPDTVTGLSSYHVLMIADIHYGAKTVPSDEIYSWLDNLSSSEKPSFCILLGDSVDTGTEYDHFATFQANLINRSIPVYVILGNHDLYNNGWKTWKTTCFQGYEAKGTSYYRFKTSNISWYFLDSANGTLGENQLYNMESEMKKDSNKKLVFSHYPLCPQVFYFSISDDTERAVMLSTYATCNVKYIFAGHYHPGISFDYGKFKELVCTSLENNKYYDLTIDETADNPVTQVDVINCD